MGEVFNYRGLETGFLPLLTSAHPEDDVDVSVELLRDLCLAPGPPGFEQAVRQRVRQALDGCGRFSHDRLGSLLCDRGGPADGPVVQLDAHLDEVGFLVQSILPSGGLRLVGMGGWWSHVLMAQPLEILTASGRRVQGLVGSTPPHFLQGEHRNRLLTLEQMLVDIGASGRDEVEAAGVQVGDPVVPRSEWVELDVADRVRCKAMDDRTGLAAMCEVLRQVGETPNRLWGVAAVQEEVGTRGAGTAVELVRPDVAIVLECTPADDAPAVEAPQARLGAGPQIRWSDPTALASRKLVDLVLRVATHEGIQVQPAVRRSGGTDAKPIHLHRCGVPCVVIGVPARYIHTHHAVIDLKDYHAMIRLVCHLVRRLDAAAVQELVNFD